MIKYVIVVVVVVVIIAAVAEVVVVLAVVVAAVLLSLLSLFLLPLVVNPNAALNWLFRDMVSEYMYVRDEV